jgi:ankyrin repeat protein
MHGNGFGEMGFAPAEFFEETSLDPAVEPRLPPEAEAVTECPSPKRLSDAACSVLDIVEAAGGGCLDRVRALAVIRPLDWGIPALLRAAVSGFPDVVTVLVKAGVSPNTPQDDQLPLCEAITNGRTTVVKALLETGATINNSPESRCSLLGAASQGNPEMIELLSSNGANLELRDYFGRTPLMIAAQGGRVANFHALLKLGADVNAKDKDGGTALVHSASTQREVVRVLLKRGAFVDAAGMDGVTALMWAAWESRDDIVRLLLEAGATVNMRDHHGDTALHKAMRSGFSDAIPILIQFGADPGLRNDDGKTPVDLAHGYQMEALQLKR